MKAVKPGSSLCCQVAGISKFGESERGSAHTHTHKYKQTNKQEQAGFGLEGKGSCECIQMMCRFESSSVSKRSRETKGIPGDNTGSLNVCMCAHNKTKHLIFLELNPLKQSSGKFPSPCFETTRILMVLTSEFNYTTCTSHEK